MRGSAPAGDYISQEELPASLRLRDFKGLAFKGEEGVLPSAGSSLPRPGWGPAEAKCGQAHLGAASPHLAALGLGLCPQLWGNPCRTRPSSQISPTGEVGCPPAESPRDPPLHFWLQFRERICRSLGWAGIGMGQLQNQIQAWGRWELNLTVRPPPTRRSPSAAPEKEG